MPCNIDIEHLFKTSNSERDKFLSRLFGIFSEEFVRIWCRDHRAPYYDIGRPTVYSDNSKRGSSLDFCLENRETKRRYVGEMKCEMQRSDYKYLALDDATQLLKHCQKKAFEDFLHISKNPNDTVVTVKRNEVQIHGSILVWGKVTDKGKTDVISKHGFADVLSLECILTDLNRWNNAEFCDIIEERADWCKHLFNGLTIPISKA